MDAPAATNSGVVVVIKSELKVAIDSDRMAAVNSDLRVAADSDGVAVISPDAMVEADSEVPVGGHWGFGSASIESDRGTRM